MLGRCQGSITFELKPLINLRSVCGFLDAPNLDLLVQDPFVAMKRRRKCWGMLLEGKLYLYKYFQVSVGRPVGHMSFSRHASCKPEGPRVV